MTNFEDAAGDYADACIVNGKTIFDAVAELADAWKEKLRDEADRVGVAADLMLRRAKER